MATNQRIVEKEIDQLLHLAVVPPDDWYEVMNGDDLNQMDRRIFNYAFEAFIAESYDSAFKGFARLSTKGSIVSQYHLGLMYLRAWGHCKIIAMRTCGLTSLHRRAIRKPEYSSKS